MENNLRQDISRIFGKNGSDYEQHTRQQMGQTKGKGPISDSGNRPLCDSDYKMGGVSIILGTSFI